MNQIDNGLIDSVHLLKKARTDPPFSATHEDVVVFVFVVRGSVFADDAERFEDVDGLRQISYWPQTKTSRLFANDADHWYAV